MSKKALSVADLEAQTALELPERRMLALIRIDVQNVLNNNDVDVRVPITVRDVNVAVAAAVAVVGAAGAATGPQT